jgi:hypothetical protein
MNVHPYGFRALTQSHPLSGRFQRQRVPFSCFMTRSVRTIDAL